MGFGSLMVGSYLAMDPGNVTNPIDGIPTKEPAFGLDALWITAKQKEEATYIGYTVVDISTIIATHLTEIVRQNIHDLLGRQELQVLLDTLKQHSPKVVEDLIPALLPLGSVLRVLKSLLREGVSIRDLKTILEVLADVSVSQKNPEILTEHVRAALSRSITKKLVDSDGQLNLITLDRVIEETIAAGMIQTDQGQQLSVDPEFVRSFIAELNQQIIKASKKSHSTVLICSPVIRYQMKSLVDRFIPNVTVLSHNEISSNITVKSIGTVRLAYAS